MSDVEKLFLELCSRWIGRDAGSYSDVSVGCVEDFGSGRHSRRKRRLVGFKKDVIPIRRFRRILER